MSPQRVLVFFFNDTATTEIYTLSLHDALPICVAAAQARKADVALVDTAGRLHTKSNLMDELRKVKRTLGKAIPGAPHDVWLILDATVGQNGLAQARQFHEALGVTGVILTKLDGTAKCGIVLAVAGELGLPVRYIRSEERRVGKECRSRWSPYH